MLREILERLLQRQDLSTDQARDLMRAIVTGSLPVAGVAAVLTALRMKGETVGEIAGFAAVMREAAIAISPDRVGIVDTCGTGGDGLATFNISTATALVVAAMGIPVAKHGNRAVSSRCGSADVLEELGVNLDLTPSQVTDCIEQLGIGFLFAPALHPAMRHVAPVRKELGVRTIFNVLGPLSNPAGVKRQLLGVFAPELTTRLAGVLAELGSERAFVVHGEDGSDELSICGETVVSELRDGQITTSTVTPEAVGLSRARADTLAGGSSRENARLIRKILAGEDSPRTDAVLLNAGFVAVLADRVEGAAEGVNLARETIQSGRAEALLEQLQVSSHRLVKEVS